MKAVDPQGECPHTAQERIKASTNGGLCPVCLDNSLRGALLQLSILQSAPKELQVQILKQEISLLWKVLELITRPA